MTAILKRELSSYFSSAIGYIVLAVFYLFAGIYFFSASLYRNSASLNNVFSNLFTVVAFLIPILTMRLISEDKKQKTDQALFTAPVRLSSIALGKYFAALILYVISISVTLLYAIVISFFVRPDWPVVLGNFLGLFLLGAALIAIGMFLSSLTENQVIAAVSGFAVAIFVIMMDFISSIIPVQFISNILRNISFTAHYSDFTMGIFNLVDVFFFLSVSALFVFLTVRIFEKKRWS